MLRALILGLFGALVSAGGAQAGGWPVVLVAVPDRSEVAAVDLSGNRVFANIRVPRGPRELAATQDLSHVLVTSPAAGAVTLVDAFSQRVVKVWRGLGNPSDVVVEGLRAYVTDATRGELVVIDLATRRIAARIPVGPRPRAVAVGDLAVIAHEGRRGLTLVDVARRRVVGTIPLAGAIGAVTKQPDTANVFVTFRDSGDVALVDWGRRIVVFRRAVAVGPTDLVKDVFVGENLWLADSAADRVLLVSAGDGRVRRRLSGCPGARRLAQIGTASIVASCGRAASIAVWDTARSRLQRIRVGGAPAGVAIAVLLSEPTSSRLLGRSHEGRPIYVTRAGNPQARRRVLVVGCTHGDECAGMAVTKRILELRPRALDLWVMPNLNPDGFARRTRGNARGVDLNRDFDAFSQPETRIARDLIRRLRPDVTIWFHQPQGLVRAWGPSRAAARRYARLAAVRYQSLRWPPGAATRWQNGLGQKAFVVELPAGKLSDEAADRHAQAVLRVAG